MFTTINNSMINHDSKCQQTNSFSTVSSDNENQQIPQGCIGQQFNQKFTCQFYRSELFCSFSDGCKPISSKVNRSAVSWIQTNCWVKNFDQNTTILSIILYYAYCAKVPFEKNKLELILSACIFFAKKYASRPPMSVDTALDMISQKYEKIHIFEIQAKLFQIIEYDLHFQTILSLLPAKNLHEESASKVNFLVELILLKNSEILFNENMLSQLIVIVQNLRQGSQASINSTETLQTIGSLLKYKQSQILINKYQSYFDVEQFKGELLGLLLQNQKSRRSV